MRALMSVLLAAMFASTAAAQTLDDAVSQCKKITDTARERECLALVQNEKALCSGAPDKDFCVVLNKYVRPAGQYSRCSSITSGATFEGASALDYCTALFRRYENACNDAFDASTDKTDCKLFVAALEIMDRVAETTPSSASPSTTGSSTTSSTTPTTPTTSSSPPSRPPPPPPARIANFRTRSMANSGAGTLEHIVQWESTTGDLAGLGNIRTRESVMWMAAPEVFGAAAEYRSTGSHNGLGDTFATSGSGTDNHSIIPTGFLYATIPDGTESPVWKMRQVYQYSVDGGPWQDIPGSRYEITRWFERQGNDLVAYLAKRGLDDGQAQRALVKVPGYFR